MAFCAFKAKKKTMVFFLLKETYRMWEDICCDAEYTTLKKAL